MRSRPVTHRLLLAPAALAAIVLLVAGCGGSSKPKSSSSPSAGASSSASTSAAPSSSPSTFSSAGGAAAVSQIKANWVKFFNAKTPTSEREQLLQNGTKFGAVLAAQAKNPLTSGSSATVSKVSVTSPTQAAVTYSVLVGGHPALSNQSGVAVKQSGTWKVGDQSFCGLLSMEYGGSAKMPSSLKALCGGTTG